MEGREESRLQRQQISLRSVRQGCNLQRLHWCWSLIGAANAVKCNVVESEGINRVIWNVRGSFGVRNFRDFFDAISLSVTGK